MNESRRNVQWFGIVLSMVVVFIVDLVTPLGIEVWVFYLPVILVPVFFNNSRQVVILGVTCSVLVVIGHMISPQAGNPLWWDVLNRLMGLLAISLSAYTGIVVCSRTARLKKALADLQQETELRRQAEQVLREHEERLRLAMEGAGMGTWDWNIRTDKIVWSETHFRMLGYEPAPGGEATQEMWLSRVHPDDRREALDAAEAARRERSLHGAEYRIYRAEGENPHWLATFGRYLYDTQGEAVRFIGVSFDITRRKELEREIFGREVLRIAAREQQQIGQALHDDVGQELTGLAMMAQSLAQRQPEAAQEKRVIARLVAGFDDLHRKVRELSRGLIPVHVETRGLSAALEELATKTTEQSGVSVTFECPEWIELPDHQTSTEMFRIAQEAVTNALRHGRPGQIRLTLLAEPNGLRLRIKDDGIGVQGWPKASDGLGLHIMAHRAELIGGVLQIGASEEGGTMVTLTLPRREINGQKEPGSEACHGASLDRG